jgi:hypothetical protein
MTSARAFELFATDNDRALLGFIKGPLTSAGFLLFEAGSLFEAQRARSAEQPMEAHRYHEFDWLL